MQNIILPAREQVPEVIIAADNDAPGLEAASKLENRLCNEGYVVRIIYPEKEGYDYNDVLRENHGK